jgi:hypothetical protein
MRLYIAYSLIAFLVAAAVLLVVGLRRNSHQNKWRRQRKSDAERRAADSARRD